MTLSLVSRDIVISEIQSRFSGRPDIGSLPRKRRKLTTTCTNILTWCVDCRSSDFFKRYSRLLKPKVVWVSTSSLTVTIHLFGLFRIQNNGETSRLV